MPDEESHRTSRWERKLATLEPGSDEYNEHLKSKPVAATAAPKRTTGKRAGKSSKRKLNNKWGNFKLLPRQC